MASSWMVRGPDKTDAVHRGEVQQKQGSCPLKLFALQRNGFQNSINETLMKPKRPAPSLTSAQILRHSLRIEGK